MKSSAQVEKELAVISLSFSLWFGNHESGCGSIGRAVASDTRNVWFESRNQQIWYKTFIYCQ